MKILQLKESERIKESLRSLTEEFIKEYPYYSTGIEKNKATFKDGTRVVYELKDNEKTVGYMMVHFSTQKCVILQHSFIRVFPRIDMQLGKVSNDTLFFSKFSNIISK